MLRSRHVLRMARRCLATSSSSEFAIAPVSIPGDARYDVLVVGGGHAGVEAAAAAARAKCNTLLVTHKVSTVGEMSCNPSFGGIGKGHLLKEVDAMDGVCARVCDRSGVQYKVLNRRKGPAVQGPRAQIDRRIFKERLQEAVAGQEGLKVAEAAVEDLCVEDGKCVGVILSDGRVVSSSAVILCTGTFLRGRINIGLETRAAGRLGDGPAVGLALTLEKSGFRLGRLKTGTPPRLRRDTVDFSRLAESGGDDPPVPFSFLSERVWLEAEEQVPCHLTYTNEKMKDIVLSNMDRNRHVTEETTGPRYCPSLESKFLRFRHTSEHQVWLEPEGFESDLVYPQGLSCTLPPEEQQRLVNCAQGLEECVVEVPGYGVEYDYVDPRQLWPSLETKPIPGLYFAGQINGTTGYEEAAAQGIVAGINASLAVRGRPPLRIDRTEAYVGVLIDDLTTLGTSEPYRMFTSRAEFRVHLRPDNADLRLTPKAIEAGCTTQERTERFTDLKESLSRCLHSLKSDVRPRSSWRRALASVDSSGSHKMSPNGPQTLSAHDVLGSHSLGIEMEHLAEMDESRPYAAAALSAERSRPALRLCARAKTESTYERHVERQREEVEELRRDLRTELRLPSMDARDMEGEAALAALSAEEREKLAEARPPSLAAAARIQGVTPRGLLALLRFAKKKDIAGGEGKRDASTDG